MSQKRIHTDRLLTTTSKPPRDPWAGMAYRPNPTCPFCHGAGFVHPVDDCGFPVYDKVVPCKAHGCILDSHNQYHTSPTYERTRGIAPSEQTFENFRCLPGNEEALRYARTFASNAESEWIWLLVYGKPGNGKSHLCNATARVLNRNGVPVKVTTTANMLSQLRKAVRGEGMDVALDEYKDVFYLIIDDFGIEKGTDWEKATIDDLMVTRYEQLRPTMVTTNIEPSQLPPRMRSRFEDTELARIVENTADDYRRQK